MSRLTETTIRDFGGGWNVSDSDKSLSSRFQPVSDNVIRGTDGHFKIRQGYKLFSRMENGTVGNLAAGLFDFATISSTGTVRITRNGHGLSSGNHVTISGITAAINGISAEKLNRTHGIVVNDANSFDIYVRAAATATSSVSVAASISFDTHILSGRTIFGRYYKDNLIVFAENGEIAAININGVATRIWSYDIAKALSVEPWAYSPRISAEIIRGRLIAVNGALNDKPLAIDGVNVNYLVDASSLSNAAIPRAEFVIAASQYVVLVNTEYGPTMLEIGAKNTVFTGSRDPNPSDAVELDLGMMTQTVDNTILGASVIRSRVFIGFSDRSMLGSLGIYTESGGTQFHEPDFNDNIAEFGTFSHSSIVSLGNDMFCAGMNGINSLEVSRASGEFVPQTVSDFIHPVMLRHFFRLSEHDRRYRIFALFDPTSRHYMLFAPKYSTQVDTLPRDAVIASTTLQPHNLMYLRYPNHKVDAGDYLDISGVTDLNAFLPASLVNGRRRIRHVIDKSTIVIEVDQYPPNINEAFGGTAIKISPVNDETVGYVYEYNPRLKIRRWTRFRGLDFDWGTRSQFNRVFFGKDGDIWQMGDTNSPYSADKLGDYTHAAYTNNYAYKKGDRVRAPDGLVFEVLKDLISPATGTLEDAVLADDTLWSEYVGIPINWELETAWSDFGMRKENKQIEHVGFDTSGESTFSFAIYTDSIKYDFESLLSDPNRTTSFDYVLQGATVFIGADGKGFGAGSQPFGGGRNTDQEWLYGMPVFGKLFRLRFSGASVHPLQINAVTMYYHKSKVQT